VLWVSPDHSPVAKKNQRQNLSTGFGQKFMDYGRLMAKS